MSHGPLVRTDPVGGSAHARQRGRAHATPRGTSLATMLVVALVLVALPTAVLFAPSPAGARRPQGEPDPIDRELALARQALILGDTEEAIRIYEDILGAHPDDDRAFWGVGRAYAAAGLDREKLIPLLTGALEESPKNLEMKRLLGEAHARLDEYERAHEIWLSALRDRKPDPDSYGQIGALEMRYRMFDHAIEIYLEGRRLIRSEGIFAQELVEAYTMVGDHDAAITECLVTVLEHRGRAQWATNRVELMLEQGASRRDVERRMREIMEDGGMDPPTLEFVGSVYRVLRRFSLRTSDPRPRGASSCGSRPSFSMTDRKRRPARRS